MYLVDCIEMLCVILSFVLICLLFSCGDDYRGEYCQYDNPCSRMLSRCLNGATCRIVESLGGGIDARCDCALGKLR